MTISETNDIFQMEFFEKALKNGLYDVAEKHVFKHRLLIKKTMEKHPYERWTLRWLTKKILEGQSTTLRYECLVTNILEIKYGVGCRNGL